MSDERPVLVIHGVANHDKAAFEQRVAEFNQRVNAEAASTWRFLPVYWGDLGAVEEGIEDTIPSPPLLSLLPVRDSREEPDTVLAKWHRDVERAFRPWPGWPGRRTVRRRWLPAGALR